MPNGALYSRPRIRDDGHWTFGMTGGRTLRNLRENPWALFLWDEGGYRGKRFSLKLVGLETEGPALAEVRENATRVVGPEAGAHVEAVGVFELLEDRPLVGR
jgi:hypothetical protein